MIEFWFDGCCEPVNPGGYGAYGIFICKEGMEIFKEGKFVGNGVMMSNNVAEYKGFVAGLAYLLSQGFNKDTIIVKGDSKLVIEQMKGNWRIKKGIYVPIAEFAKILVRNFPKVEFLWIPREDNSVCDGLGKDELKKLNVEFRIQPE